MFLKFFNYLKYLDITRYILKKGNTFDIYFGVPGSGKTTFAAWLAKKQFRRKRTVHSNMFIKGAYKISTRDDIGKYEIRDTLLIIDEAGIEYDNRRYRDFSAESVEFYKYHRKYNVDVAVFSQDHEDMDIKLRKLATTYYLVKRSIIPFFVVRRRIAKWIGIDKETNQFIEKYKFVFLSRRWIFCYPLWKYFKSEETNKELPKKEFEKYE